MAQLVVIGAAVGLGAVGSVFANRTWTGIVRLYHMVKKKKDFKWQTDEDSRRRKCTVRWVKRRIFGLTHHWALSFDWGDYSATYEGVQEDGYLIPKWNEGAPNDGSSSKKCGENCLWEVEKTYQVSCSPKEVNEKAFKIRYNGAKYILTKINCHLWARKLAQSLGIWSLALGPGEEWIPMPATIVIEGLNNVRNVFRNSK